MATYILLQVLETSVWIPIVLTLAAIVLVTKLLYPRHNLPPGPWGFPIVGHVPLFGSDTKAYFAKLRRQYGDVFRVRLGSFPAVVLNGQNVIQDALMRKADDFAGRADFYTNRIAGEHLAFGPYNEAWKIHKKLAIKTIHAFAGERTGKIGDIIADEAVQLAESFASRNGQPFDPKKEVYTATCSVPYQLCYGQGESVRDDQDFIDLMNSFKVMIEFINAGNPMEIMPWLARFVPSKVKRYENINKQQHVIRFKKTDDRAKRLAESSDEITCIVDSFVSKSYDSPEMIQAGFTKSRMLTTIDEYIAAAFDTTGTVFRWVLVNLVIHPGVQSRILREVEDIVGNSRRPALSDRPHMPYTEATILETLRAQTPIPLSLPHSAVRDAKLAGYDIPKGTVVLINLHSLATDENVWEKPEQFDPSRFLDKDGHLDAKKASLIAPFGMGVRMCLGEFMARMELFVFTASIVQRFELLPTETEYNMTPVPGLTDSPAPNRLIARLRV